MKINKTSTPPEEGFFIAKMPSVETTPRFAKETELQKPVVIMKFGGTSVGSAAAIENISNSILKNYSNEGQHTVVVVSAMSGITNKLVGICDSLDDNNKRQAEHLSREVLDLHFTTASELHLNAERRTELHAEMRKLISEIVINRDKYSESQDPLQVRDLIISAGERLSSRLVATSCQQHGLDAIAYDASEFIKTDENFGSASPDYFGTRRAVKSALVPVLKENKIPIVTGFIGSSLDGRTTTLGRGGSDFTATILGKVLSAREVWIWTDVNGVYATDPNKDRDAKHFAKMSFTHADKMAKNGSKVLYPKTCEPLLDTDTIIRVRNTFSPESGETLIVNDTKYLSADL